MTEGKDKARPASPSASLIGAGKLRDDGDDQYWLSLSEDCFARDWLSDEDEAAWQKL